MDNLKDSQNDELFKNYFKGPPPPPLILGASLFLPFLPLCQCLPTPHPLSTRAIWSWMKKPLLSSPQASEGSAGTR